MATAYDDLMQQRINDTAWNTATTADYCEEMSLTVQALHREMSEARKCGQQALQIQQHLLQEPQYQSYVEKLIYLMDKALVECRNPKTTWPPAAQYAQLEAIATTIRKEGIATSVIQGRENKAAFEKSLKEVGDMLKRLQDHPDVKQALASERKHELKKKIEALTALKNYPERFSVWHKHFFKFAYDMGSPTCYIVISFVWIAYGFMWLPVAYWVDGLGFASDNAAVNAAVDAKIKTLQQELAEI